MKKYSRVLMYTLGLVLLLSACSNSGNNDVKDETLAVNKDAIENVATEYFNSAFLNSAITRDQESNYVTTFSLNSGSFRITDFTYNMDSIIGGRFENSMDRSDDTSVLATMQESKIDRAYMWHDIKRFSSAASQSTYFSDFLSNYKDVEEVTWNGITYNKILQDDVIMLMYNDMNTNIIHKFTIPLSYYNYDENAYLDILRHIYFSRDEALNAKIKMDEEYQEAYSKYLEEKEAFAPIEEKQRQIFVENNITSDEALDAYLNSLSAEELEEQDALFSIEAPEEPDKMDGIVAFTGGWFIYGSNMQIYRNNIDSAMYIGYGGDEGIEFTYETSRQSLPDGYDYNDIEAVQFIVANITSDADYEIQKIGNNIYQVIESFDAPSGAVAISGDGSIDSIQENPNKNILYKHYDPKGFVTTINLFDKKYKEQLEAYLETGVDFDYSYAEEINTVDMQEFTLEDVTFKLPSSWTEGDKGEGIGHVYYSPEGSESFTVIKKEIKGLNDANSVAAYIWSNYCYGFMTEDKLKSFNNRNYVEVYSAYTDRIVDMYFSSVGDTLYMFTFWGSPFKYSNVELRYIGNTILNSVVIDNVEGSKLSHKDGEYKMNSTSYEISSILLDKVSSIIGEDVNIANSYGLYAYATQDASFYIYELSQTEQTFNEDDKALLGIISFSANLFDGEKYGLGTTSNGNSYLERGGMFIVPDYKNKGTYYIGVEGTDKYTLETIEEIIDVLKE